jgi:hypothetical protein
MHVTCLGVSQVLSEEKSAGSSGSAVVLLGFGMWQTQFLCAFAGYEDGSAVFEVLFNLAKINLL